MPLDQLRFFVPQGRDVIEIVLVTLVLYRILRFLAGTRALQIVFGLVVLAGIYVAAFLLKFTMITYLLGVVFTYGAFAALVVFQPELRNALARLGQTRLFALFTTRKSSVVADHLVEAIGRLGQQRIGAIIAVEKAIGLDEYLGAGTALEATVSADLLATIFSPYSPLHDGAVLIRGEHIVGAGCILPLTQYPVADRSLGTRHRAAIGLSEETDALVVVVSEETATISLALRGALYRGLTLDQVRAVLSGQSITEAAPELAPLSRQSA